MSGRIRTVKPEWLEDELLALASSDARVLSIALVLLADDHGRGRANRLVLAGQVFPGKPRETLGKAIEELRVARYVTIYEIDGQSYFQIRNWFKHQRVDHPSKGRVPAPPADSSGNNGNCEDARETLENPREGLGDARASRDPDRGPGTGTDPEKPARPRRWKRFPGADEFTPKEDHRKLAAELGLDLDEQMALIRDHEYKDPKSDPDATLRTWLKRAPSMGTGRFSQSPPPKAASSPAADSDRRALAKAAEARAELERDRRRAEAKSVNAKRPSEPPSAGTGQP